MIAESKEKLKLSTEKVPETKKRLLCKSIEKFPEQTQLIDEKIIIAK